MTRLLRIFVVLAVLSGCTAGKPETTAQLADRLPGDASEADAGWSSPQDPAIGEMFRRIVDRALGTPYVRGGTSVEGFDCSGFVQWTYKNLGIELPRTAREQSQAGSRVSQSDLRIGDIVTFRHPRRGWHCGIYMGDDQFAHSPRRGQRVRYSSLNERYFRANFVVARRVMQNGAAPDFEEVSRRLEAWGEKRFIPDPKRKTSKKSKGRSRAVADRDKKTNKAKGRASASAIGGREKSPGKDGRGRI